MDIYELISVIIPTGTRHLNASSFDEESFNALTDDDDKDNFILLKNIASLGVNYHHGDTQFSPTFEWADGRRTFSVEDLADDDYVMLYSLELDRLPSLLALRIADILWVKKNDYKMALLAIRISHELFVNRYDLENWVDCVEFIEHAVKLAARINAKELNGYLQEIFDKIIELNGEDSSLLSISLIELLVSQKWGELDAIISILDNIIVKSHDNIHKARKAFEQKTKLLYKKNDTEAALENNRQLACYLEKIADDEKTDNIQSLFLAEKYFEEAIHLYRNNGSPGDGERVHMKLIKVQEKIPQHMIPISASINTTQEYEKVLKLFDGLSFNEFIVRLTQCTPLYTKDMLKQKVLTDAVDPISCLFGSGLKTSRGQTIAMIPPIDIQDPESNIEVLEMHMHQTALMMESIHGDTVLKWAMDSLNKSIDFSAHDLDFLINGNPIIPAGRENIFRDGLFYGLSGNLYMSLHILSPQIENLFRFVAESAGATMTTLKDDSTSDAKLLKSIFDTPELVECYDNDILFLFKGILNEKTGGNIRNEIAHGIMSERKGNSGVARFFFCWVLKLLSFTSSEFYQIGLDSEKDPQ